MSDEQAQSNAGGLPVPRSTEGGSVAYPLASGRQVRVSTGADWQSEHLQVISPDGKVEIEILLTANGPVVRVSGGALQMDSPNSIQLRAAGGVEIEAEELRVRTRKSVHLNGETIRLNCDEGVPPEGGAAQLEAPPETKSGCCEH